jgi:hypothetical protein
MRTGMTAARVNDIYREFLGDISRKSQGAKLTKMTKIPPKQEKYLQF